MIEHFDEAKLSEDIRREFNANLDEVMPIGVGFKRLDESAIIPTKAHASDSGFDLYALEDTIIEPGETAVVPTGIAVKLPAGYEVQVRPRSGVTTKSKLRVQLGTIDNGYTGDIGVIVDNFNTYPPNISFEFLGNVYGTDGEIIPEEFCKRKHGSHLIRRGDRIAQLVVQPMPSVQAYEIKGDIDSTARGAGGFGSTGIAWKDNVNPPSMDELMELGKDVLREGD